MKRVFCMIITVLLALGTGMLPGISKSGFSEAAVTETDGIGVPAAAEEIVGSGGTSSIVYTDVDPDSWYASYIYDLSGMGLLQGMGNGQFAPEKNITLAETVTLAARLHEKNTVAETSAENEDVDGRIRQQYGSGAGNWYEPFVKYADAKGILTAADVTDISDTALSAFSARSTFAALMTDSVSKEDLEEINALEEGVLPDVPMSASWSDEVYTLYRAGVLIGMDQFGTFAPEKKISRAEAATLLSRMVHPLQRDSLHLIEKETAPEAVYLGIQNYGKLNIDGADQFRYRFLEGGRTVTYRIGTGNGSCPVQNWMEEGGIYQLTVEGDTVTELMGIEDIARGKVEAVSASGITVNGVTYPAADAAAYRIENRAGGAQAEAATVKEGDWVRLFGSARRIKRAYIVQEPASWTPPVSGTPGVRTVKNLLLTATEPMGTTLYVYGGDWNWQDTGGSRFSTRIGLAQSWLDFFAANDADYTYKNSNASKSYYPFGKFNEYYYAGMDCSGYIGWAVYNCLHSESGGESYVMKSSGFAKNLAENCGFGNWKHSFRKAELLPGDIVSMNGHVWMCLGRCSDGSVIIMHSTPAESRTGGKGGGPELSALGSTGSEAWKLASKYMKEFYPEWSSRYAVKAIAYDSYDGGTLASTGRFTWNMGVMLTDPDGYRSMDAAAILKDMYGR